MDTIFVGKISCSLKYNFAHLVLKDIFCCVWISRFTVIFLNVKNVFLSPPLHPPPLSIPPSLSPSLCFQIEICCHHIFFHCQYCLFSLIVCKFFIFIIGLKQFHYDVSWCGLHLGFRLILVSMHLQF